MSSNNLNILSFDVGIKHLGLCLIKKDKQTGKFNIDKWINIDLTNSKQLTCCATLKKKNKKDIIDVVCGKIAKYSSQSQGQCPKYYCKTHMSHAEFDHEAFEKELVKDCTEDENVCTFIKTNGKECGANSKCTIENNALCTPHKKSVLNKKIKEVSLKPIKKDKCMNTDPQTLYNAIFAKLEEFDYIKEVNEVYIENQPVFKNPTMKTVSIMLFSYFANYSLKNKLDMKVKFVSPTFKINLNQELVTFTDEYISEHNKDKDKRDKCRCRICKLSDDLKSNKEKLEQNYIKYKFSYDSIKELGIVYTKKILKDNNILDKFKLLDVCDKKDDLCDAFLHGYKKL